HPRWQHPARRLLRGYRRPARCRRMPRAARRRRSPVSSPLHSSLSPGVGAIGMMTAALREVERSRVDAIALPGGLRTVLEDVSQVRTAATAQHFLADHAMAGVADSAHPVAGERQPEARPPGPGVVLVRGAEELGT